MICRTRDRLAEVVAEPSLFRAWQKIAARNSMPGVDRVSVEDFARHCTAELHRLRADILARTYRPMPLATFSMKKKNGFRELTVATVRDRIVARAVADHLVGSLDSQLQPESYAYRPGRSAPGAVVAVQRACREAAYAVRVDIENFFDSIDHGILNETLMEFGVDESLVLLIMQLVKNVRFNGVATVTPAAGVPQGAPVAPVLSNLYLDALDRRVRESGCPFIRYADDLVVFAPGSNEAGGALAAVNDGLSQLKLKASLNKTRVYSMDEGFLFLGFHFNRNGHAPGAEARASLQHKLKRERSGQVTDAEHEHRQQVIVRGWENYFLAAPAECCPPGTRPETPAREEDRTPAASGSNANKAAAPLPETDEMPARREIPESPNAAAPVGAADAAAVGAEVATAVDRLACGRFGEAITRLRRLLNDESLALTDELRRTCLGHLADAYTAQGLAGAASSCRQQAGLPTQSSRSRDIADTQVLFGAADVDIWLDLFGGGAAPVYRQYVDRLGRHGYKPGSGPLTPAHLKDHWDGRHTLAIPVFDSQNAVRFGLVDLDVSRPVLDRCDRTGLDRLRAALLDDARGLLERAHTAGVEGLIEDSGYKGYHVWFFMQNRMEAALMHRFLVELVRVSGAAPEGTHRELFPGSARRGPELSGERIKLPLGIHRLTGRRSIFLSPDGQPCEQGVVVVNRRICNQARALRGAIEQWTRYAAPAATQQHNAGDQGPAAVVMNGCAVMRGLAARAKESGHLAHIERCVLRAVLGAAGESGRKAVHDILRPCRNYSRATTDKNLARRQAQPMSCARIQEVLGDFCSLVTCDCRFKLRKGEYAHPLRHLAGDRKPGHAEPARPPAEGAPAEMAHDVSDSSLPEETPASHNPPASAGSCMSSTWPGSKERELPTILTEFRQARQRLLALQNEIGAAMKQTGQLALGTLTSDGPDPDILRWIVHVS